MTTAVRQKDPKKVAAGKALAERNRTAREAQAREMAREEMAREEMAAAAERRSLGDWGLSLNTALGIAGLGIGLYGLYLARRSDAVPRYNCARGADDTSVGVSAAAPPGPRGTTDAPSAARSLME